MIKISEWEVSGGRGRLLLNKEGHVYEMPKCARKESKLKEMRMKAGDKAG